MSEQAKIGENAPGFGDSGDGEDRSSKASWISSTSSASCDASSGQRLEVSGLSFEVDGNRLVNDVNLKMDGCSLTMIMGPNGAGKSLFLRLIHGLISATSGEVCWNGSLMNDGLRRRQGMVFQRPVVLRRSVGANMDFAASLRGEVDASLRDRLLDRVGLLDRAAQPARLLSGGEQQRLSLARILVGDPEMLMLDEPTASLDPASVLMIEEIVQELHGQGRKIIFVSHDLAQARRLADEIVFMHKGKVLEQTPAKEFFDRPKSGAGRDFLAGRIIT